MDVSRDVVHTLQFLALSHRILHRHLKSSSAYKIIKESCGSVGTPLSLYRRNNNETLKTTEAIPFGDEKTLSGNNTPHGLQLRSDVHLLVDLLLESDGLIISVLCDAVVHWDCCFHRHISPPQVTSPPSASISSQSISEIKENKTHHISTDIHKLEIKTEDDPSLTVRDSILRAHGLSIRYRPHGVFYLDFLLQKNMIRLTHSLSKTISESWDPISILNRDQDNLILLVVERMIDIWNTKEKSTDSFICDNSLLVTSEFPVINDPGYELERGTKSANIETWKLLLLQESPRLISSSFLSLGAGPISNTCSNRDSNKFILNNSKVSSVSEDRAHLLEYSLPGESSSFLSDLVRFHIGTIKSDSTLSSTRRPEIFEIFTVKSISAVIVRRENMLTGADGIKEKMPNDGIRDLIDKDCSRTPSKKCSYKNLQRLLRAYSARNSTIGYCQGMSYIASFLIRIAPLDCAYIIFCDIIENRSPGVNKSMMFSKRGWKDKRLVFTSNLINENINTHNRTDIKDIRSTNDDLYILSHYTPDVYDPMVEFSNFIGHGPQDTERGGGPRRRGLFSWLIDRFGSYAPNTEQIIKSQIKIKIISSAKRLQNKARENEAREVEKSKTDEEKLVTSHLFPSIRRRTIRGVFDGDMQLRIFSGPNKRRYCTMKSPSLGFAGVFPTDYFSNLQGVVVDTHIITKLVEKLLTYHGCAIPHYVDPDNLSVICCSILLCMCTKNVVREEENATRNQCHGLGKELGEVTDNTRNPEASLSTESSIPEVTLSCLWVSAYLLGISVVFKVLVHILVECIDFEFAKYHHLGYYLIKEISHPLFRHLSSVVPDEKTTNVTDGETLSNFHSLLESTLRGKDDVEILKKRVNLLLAALSCGDIHAIEKSEEYYFITNEWIEKERSSTRIILNIQEGDPLVIRFNGPQRSVE